MAESDNGSTLFVEANDDYRILLAAAMKRIGREDRFRTVSDPVEAINYLTGAGEYANRVAHRFPQMLFLDLHMPKMNGFDFLRWS